jgi:hypothetical protein
LNDSPVGLRLIVDSTTATDQSVGLAFFMAAFVGATMGNAESTIPTKANNAGIRFC